MKTRDGMKSLLILGTLFFVVFFGSVSFWSFLHMPVYPDSIGVDPKANVKVFVINEGESVDSIAERLEEEKLIRSAWVFKFELKRAGKEKQIAAGDFKLSSSMPLSEIIKTLTLGPVDRWVTLIEGWRVEEIAERLENKLGFDKKEFLKVSKEGYMFPDTYLFNPDAKEVDIAEVMRANFEKKFDENLRQEIKSKGLSQEQGVILASIVEREARSDEARKMVASILLKRLKIGMKLDADATVQYALGYQASEKSWWKRHLVSGDKQVKSPYNTYTNPGLPPAPICNPSLSSLKAVAEADSSVPYFYYYHDSKGNSYYSRTLEEHNQKVANNP